MLAPGSMMLFPKAGAAVDEDIDNHVNARSLHIAININPYFRETDYLFVMDIVLHMKNSVFMLTQWGNQSQEQF